MSSRPARLAVTVAAALLTVGTGSGVASASTPKSPSVTKQLKTLHSALVDLRTRPDDGSWDSDATSAWAKRIKADLALGVTIGKQAKATNVHSTATKVKKLKAEVAWLSDAADLIDDAEANSATLLDLADNSTPVDHGSGSSDRTDQDVTVLDDSTPTTDDSSTDTTSSDDYTALSDTLLQDVLDVVSAHGSSAQDDALQTLSDDDDAATSLINS